jgi:hypothetical protein
LSNGSFSIGLNNCKSGDGAMVTAGYAGWCDWRIPQIDELLTIVDCSFGNPCIDEAVFGATNATSFYWSSSIVDNFPGSAWSVYFGGGFADVEDGNFQVRAVRGGS